MGAVQSLHRAQSMEPDNWLGTMILLSGWSVHGLGKGEGSFLFLKWRGIGMGGVDKAL